MTCYPVIIPTLNRYEHFKNCVESLSKNSLANETELIIGLDYPPSEKYEEGWKKIKEYIPTITGFKSITCFERTENLGSMNNSSELENYVLSKYDAYIYTEDDNVFSPFFLQFINDGLENFKYDNDIYAICGYSYPIKWKTKKDCILQYQYFSAWGCGIWKNKEFQFKKNIKNSFFINNFCDNKKIKHMLLNSPSNFACFIGQAFNEKIPYTDITRSFYMYLNNLKVLMPAKTLVTNLGWDGSGDHCLENTKIDFSNHIRNNEKPIDVKNFDFEFSKELEKAIYTLKPKFTKARAIIICLLIKFIGYNKTSKLRKILKKI